MIKIENDYTGNWKAAIRGMRNPMNSWDKSDSGYKLCSRTDCSKCIFYSDDGYKSHCHYVLDYPEDEVAWCIGDNDLILAKQLSKAGTDHGKFLRMITFSCDITAPLYWWKEMDTYKVGTVRNSCSTMHKIMSKEFEREDFSFTVTDSTIKNDLIEDILKRLNDYRQQYLLVNDDDVKKDVWQAVIEILPSSYNQKATWSANYEVLKNIYHARKNHKLQEWRDFCKMIEVLPYSELITLKEE